MNNASPASKALPLGFLVVVFAASLTLFLLGDQRYINTLPSLVKNYRNVTQIIVQILSTIFSIAQVLILCSLLNFAARIKLFRSSTSINNLSFWSALSTPRFDKTLPPTRLLFVILMLALSTGLGALWTGSLTPLSSTASRNDGKILVPFFNSSLTPFMYPRSYDGAMIEQCDNRPTSDPRGPAYPDLDNCIVQSKLGNLILTASTATNVTSPRQHPKIDNSTWTYSGRSYGKGSSTGLFEVSNTTEKSADQGFSYQESGYIAQVSCAKQANAVFPFDEYNTGGDGQMSLWSSNTVILDSGNVSIIPFDVATPVWNGFNSHPFGYFAWTAFSHEGVNYVVTSSTQAEIWSLGPSDILCTVDFIPTTFRTNVSTTDQYITITPLERIDSFNQTGNVTDAIMLDLDLMSRMSSSSVAFSSLFSAINTNYLAAQVAYGASNDTAWELALRDAIVGVIDDLLTYQGILAVARGDGESVPQPVQRHFAAIRIGETKYHIAQLVINIVLCMVYLYEAIRTQYWKFLPDFDFLDIKALTLAALGPEELSGRAPATSQSPSSSRQRRDNSTRLVGFYDEKSRPRLRYANAPPG